MLSRSDLKAIENIVDSKLDEKLDSKLDQKLKPMQKQLNRIEKRLDRTIDFFDNHELKIVDEIIKIEKHVGLPIMEFA